MWKSIIFHFALGLISEYARRGKNLIQIEGARYYVQAVSSLRRFFMFLWMGLACVVIAQVGLALVIYGAVSHFVLEVENRNLAFLIVGLLLFGIPTALFFLLNSEARWSRRAGVPELLETVIPHKRTVELSLHRKDRYASK